MQVLGDLLKLPEGSDLPLPWWHRAPLGLQTGTWCYLALVESQRRPVCELIVTVLDPTELSNMLHIKCVHADEAGCVSKAIEIVKDFNIALGESVTLEAGSEHEVSLVCEALSRASRATSPLALRERLHAAGFHKIQIDTFNSLPVRWLCHAEISQGWIRGTNWRTELNKRCNDRPAADRIDLSKAVVSAGTTHRVLRFVFPYRNAKTIKVEHLDEPGVLKQLTDVLSKHRVNLLSQLLRRGGAKPKTAVLVATCEPAQGHSDPRVFEDVRRDLEALPAKLMISVAENDGVDCAHTITPEEPQTVVARTPPNLREQVKRVKSTVPRGRRTVFLSHRFVGDTRAQLITQHVREAVSSSYGWHLLEASPGEEGEWPHLVFTDVCAKMWTANAAIVLITGLPGDDAVGRNLPHEFGFFQGQGKPILCLVDSQLPNHQASWTNIEGIFARRFPYDAIACDKDQKGSLNDIITQWLAHIRQSSGNTDISNLPSSSAYDAPRGVPGWRDDLFALSIRVLGSEEIAQTWWLTPQIALGGRKPSEMLTRSTSAQEVARYLSRIEQGVYT